MEFLFDVADVPEGNPGGLGELSEAEAASGSDDLESFAVDSHRAHTTAQCGDVSRPFSTIPHSRLRSPPLHTTQRPHVGNGANYIAPPS